MTVMTARQPRRARRRAAPAQPLPRPVAGALAEAETPAAESHRAARHAPPRAREHHVTADYSYVHRDLLTVAGVGIIVIAFIVAMSFVI